jgi:hypothetical protein
MGRASLGGRAVELFVRDDLAFVVTSAESLSCAPFLPWIKSKASTIICRV